MGKTARRRSLVAKAAPMLPATAPQEADVDVAAAAAAAEAEGGMEAALLKKKLGELLPWMQRQRRGGRDGKGGRQSWPSCGGIGDIEHLRSFFEGARLAAEQAVQRTARGVSAA